MSLMATKQQPHLGTEGRSIKKETLKGKVSISHVVVAIFSENRPHIFAYVSDDCGVSVSHNFEGHVHETHGHKTTTSSGHGGEEHTGGHTERKGIFF